MRVAALYDIHGNLPALEAVLQEIEGLKVDKIVVGGDLILGPMSRECLDLLMEIRKPIDFILGNCELSVLDQMMSNPPGNFPPNVIEDIRWTADQLRPEHRDILEKWPKTITLEIGALGKVLFCHATPRSETEIFTRLTAEEKLLPIFGNLEANFVVCGHTHMQFNRTVGKTKIINAGSVGMPFAKPAAYWLLVGPGFEFRHTDYDLIEAAKRIEKTEYPHAEDFAKNNVLNPPTEKAMLEILSRAELK